MAKDFWNLVDYLIEFREVYDGWSAAKLKDGTYVNRWANDNGTGPAEGYERRYSETEKRLQEFREKSGT